jgi:hypothetical protein
MHVRRSMGHKGLPFIAILATYSEFKAGFYCEMRRRLCYGNIHYHGNCKFWFYVPNAVGAVVLIAYLCVSSSTLLYGVDHSTTTGKHQLITSNVTRHLTTSLQILYLI